MRVHITDESVLAMLRDCSSWALIDDELCHPEGALRAHAQGMVKRGLLLEDGEAVTPVDPARAHQLHAAFVKSLRERRQNRRGQLCSR